MKKYMLLIITICAIALPAQAIFDTTKAKAKALADKAKPIVEKGKAAVPHLKNAYDAYNKAGTKPVVASEETTPVVKSKTPAEIKAEKDAANKAAGKAKQAEIKENKDLFAELPFAGEDDSFFE